MTEYAPLKLLAADAEDLKVVASALQDAVAKIGDIEFDARRRLLTIGFNRYCWEVGSDLRVRSGLQVGSVMGLQARNLRRHARDAVVELLTIAFEPDEEPGGALILSFSGGGDLRARVECVDLVLADVSAPWPARRTPTHDL
ncbi:MAG TPA: DUF2948 family protein [Phenylobacterium sp.]|uniref:DUF2948 family protein n=1 Tax=Phenylobacterium conjunctum TaxID=1298959 RepID=A0ABW3T2Y2_9CAUL|nr:DUF2948 family protein [Phenylobacterium sp.]